MGQKWNLGVLDIDSGVRKTLEEIEGEYAAMISGSGETLNSENNEMEAEDYEMDER